MVTLLSFQNDQVTVKLINMIYCRFQHDEPAAVLGFSTEEQVQYSE